MSMDVANPTNSRSSNSAERRSGKSSLGSASGANANSLISRARRGSKSSLGSLLEQYRNYLVVLAATQIEKRLQPRVSPSDVVQETMLRAHKNSGQSAATPGQRLRLGFAQILCIN